jgi:hypothetical protein
MDAPTPRKSNLVPISFAVWFSALSTSPRLIFDTTSKEESPAMTLILGTRRARGRQVRHPDRPPF